MKRHKFYTQKEDPGILGHAEKPWGTKWVNAKQSVVFF